MMRKTVFRLAAKSIRYRRSAIFMSVISIALSVVLLLGIERIRSSVKDSFTSTISGTDLIVGARTGNLSLLLATVFHIGNLSQNVSWKAYRKWSSNPLIDWTIPISLGDSHKGYPVVGTSSGFFKRYQYAKALPLQMMKGNPDISVTSCVIGSKVAEQLGYTLNQQIELTHGMGSEDFSNHADTPFFIRGILAPTGTPIDRSIFVSLNALDQIHTEFYQYAEDDFDVFAGIQEEHQHSGEEAHPKSITGFFIGVKNKSDLLQLQRQINDESSEALLAIMPALTLIELWSIINPIEKILLVISLIVLLVSLGSVLTSILSSLNQRRREMSVLRSVGARPKLIFGLIILESTGIVLSGILIGVILLVVLLVSTQPILSEQFGLFISITKVSKNELLILSAIFLSGVFIGFVPAFRAYQRSLMDGLTLKI